MRTAEAIIIIRNSTYDDTSERVTEALLHLSPEEIGALDTIERQYRRA